MNYSDQNNEGIRLNSAQIAEIVDLLARPVQVKAAQFFNTLAFMRTDDGQKAQRKPAAPLDIAIRSKGKATALCTLQLVHLLSPAKDKVIHVAFDGFEPEPVVYSGQKIDLSEDGLLMRLNCATQSSADIMFGTHSQGEQPILWAASCDLGGMVRCLDIPASGGDIVPSAFVVDFAQMVVDLIDGKDPQVPPNLMLRARNLNRASWKKLIACSG